MLSVQYQYFCRLCQRVEQRDDLDARHSVDRGADDVHERSLIAVV